MEGVYIPYERTHARPKWFFAKGVAYCSFYNKVARTRVYTRALDTLTRPHAPARANKLFRDISKYAALFRIILNYANARKCKVFFAIQK